MTSEQEPQAKTGRIQAVVSGYPAWVGGLVTGLQAVLLTYLMVLIPAFAIVASTSSAGSVTGVPWGAAHTVSQNFWLLGFGFPAETDIATFSIVPLGVPLVAAALLVGLSRSFLIRGWTSPVVAVVSFSAAATLVAGLSHGGAAAIKVFLVSLLIAVPSVAWGAMRTFGATLNFLTDVPGWVRSGLRAATGLIASVLLIGSILSMTSAYLNRYQSVEILDQLSLDGVSGPAYALAQLGYVPNLVGWSVAWLSGQGFSVGEGTLYAPTEVITGPVPAIPILGALPSSGGGVWQLMPWALALLALIGAIALRRRISGDLEGAGSLAIAAFMAATFLALAVNWSGGVAGPGALHEVGAKPVSVGFSLFGYFALGYALYWVADWVRLRNFVEPATQLKPQQPRATVSEKTLDSPADSSNLPPTEAGNPSSRSALWPTAHNAAYLAKPQPSVDSPDQKTD